MSGSAHCAEVSQCGGWDVKSQKLTALPLCSVFSQSDNPGESIFSS